MPDLSRHFRRLPGEASTRKRSWLQQQLLAVPISPMAVSSGATVRASARPYANDLASKPAAGAITPSFSAREATTVHPLLTARAFMRHTPPAHERADHDRGDVQADAGGGSMRQLVKGFLGLVGDSDGDPRSGSVEIGGAPRWRALHR